MSLVIGLLVGGLPTVLGCLGVLLGCNSCCGGGGGSYSYQYPQQSSFSGYGSYSYPAYPRAQYYPSPPSYSGSYVPVHPIPYVVPSRPSYYPSVGSYRPATYIPPPARPGYVQPSPLYPPVQVQVSPSKAAPLPLPTYNPAPFAPPPAPDSTGNYIAPPQAVLVEATTERNGEEVEETGNNSYGEEAVSSTNRVSNNVTRWPQLVSQEVKNTMAIEYEPREPQEVDYPQPGPDDDESSPFPLVGVVTQTPEVPGQVTYNPPTVAPQTGPFFPPVSIPNYAPETSLMNQATASPPPVEEVEYAETEQEVTPAALQENQPEEGGPEVTVDGGVGDDGNSIGYGRRRKSIRAN